MGEISKFLTLKEKLLPFLSLSKSTATLFSSSAFKYDDLTLNNELIILLANYNLPSLPPADPILPSSSMRPAADPVLPSPPSRSFFSYITGSLFSNIQIMLSGAGNSDASRAVVSNSLPLALKCLPSIETFKLIKSSQYSAYLIDFVPVLTSPSLANVKKLTLEFSYANTPESAVQLKLVQFPFLQSFRFSVYTDRNNSYPVFPQPFDDFLLRHKTIIELEFYGVIGRIQWEELFLNPSALPKLNKLVFKVERVLPNWASKIDFSSIFTALASTILPSTNQPRPLEHLIIKKSFVSAEMFNSISRIASLTNIEMIIKVTGESCPFLLNEIFPSTPIKALTKFDYYFGLPDSDSERSADWIKFDPQPFFLRVCNQISLTSLLLHIPCGVKFESQSVKLLSQLNKLKHLDLFSCEFRTKKHIITLVNWTDSSMFTSWQFSSLTSLILNRFHLSQLSFINIAASTPNMAHFNMRGAFDCHGAVFCILISHYWPCIEFIRLINNGSLLRNYGTCLHTFSLFTLVEFELVKQQHPPHSRAFQRLESLEIPICECSTPEIWFKLLQLFNKAELIRCVDKIQLPDPTSMIGVMGLSYLSSLQSFSAQCNLPPDVRNAFFRSPESAVDGETVYTELRTNWSGGPSSFDPYRSQYFKISATIPDLAQRKSGPYEIIDRQFITRVVKNNMNGRQAFFDDIFRSMSVND